MEISRGGGGGGRDDPGRMTPAQRHDENPERHAGRSQGRNERRKNFAAALPSMFSRRATMPMSRAVSSAWIRTPSSKLRLNRSRNATTMVPPGWTGPISSRQPGRFMVRPLVTSVKIRSSRMPWCGFEPPHVHVWVGNEDAPPAARAGNPKGRPAGYCRANHGGRRRSQQPHAHQQCGAGVGGPGKGLVGGYSPFYLQLKGGYHRDW